MKAMYPDLRVDLRVEVFEVLGWGGEATSDAQECGGGFPLLGLLERDITVHV